MSEGKYEVVDGEGAAAASGTSTLTKGLLFLGVIVVAAMAIVILSIVFIAGSSDSEEEYPSWASSDNQMVFKTSDFNECYVTPLNHNQHSKTVICWNYSIESNWIVFGVASKTDSRDAFLGFGISGSGGMYGADIALYSPDLGLQARRASAFSRPAIDVYDRTEAVLLSAKFQGGVTSFTFRRNLQTCKTDSEEPIDAPIDIYPNYKHHVIWASGDVRFNAESELEIYYHRNYRGTEVIPLLGYIPNYVVEDKVHHPVEHKAHMNDGEGAPLNLGENFNGTDTYLCQFMNLGVMPEERHVYEIEAYVDKVDVVHHMILYVCAEPPSDAPDMHALPCSMTQCFQMVTLWAVGADPKLTYPDDVGFPIGGDENPVYLKLEIHYHSMTPPVGVMENSGFTVRTTEPRQYPAGVMFFGWVFDPQYFQLPPQQPLGHPSVTKKTYADTQCLENIDLNEDQEINVFLGSFHMHQVGKRGLLQHYRDGEEQEPVATRNFYDFNYQWFDPLNMTIKSTDKFILTCMYDTSSRDETTYGGEGSLDEMCFYFFWYYPRLPTRPQGLNTMTYFDNGETSEMFCGGKFQIQVNITEVDELPKLPPTPREECS